MTRPLGKGEVESSILSCSTIFPQENKAFLQNAPEAHCANSRMNDSGTVAGNWQGTFRDYLNRPIAERLEYDATYLYRYYTGQGDLLYVGISNQPLERHEAHLFHRWSVGADVYQIEAFPDRALALIGEWVAIEQENPLHNHRVRKQHPHWYPRFYWYRDLTGGRFVGQYPAWFVIDLNGRIAGSIGVPEWAP